MAAPDPLLHFPKSALRPGIIIVGAGTYARYLVELAEQKQFPIAGAFKRAGAHIGEDFGIVSGMGRELGIRIEDVQAIPTATPSANVALVAAGPDLKGNLETYRRLLEAGYNVLCLAPQAFDPYFFDAETAREIDAIATANNVTFTGGGIWDMSRIWAGILATGPCSEINALTHRSVTDLGRQVETIEDIQRYRLAVGITVDEFWSGGYDTNPTGSLYVMMVAQVLEAIGYHVTSFTTKIEPVVTDSDFEFRLFPEPIPAGQCIGQRITSELSTREGVTGHTEVELKLCPAGAEEYMLWEVKGVPNLSVKTIRDDSINVTVTSQFNRIPDVIAAPPGIVLISQMGPLKHTALA